MDKSSWKILSILISVAIISTGWSIYQTKDWAGAALNFGTEMAGAVVIYLLLEIVLGTRQKKEQIIANMGSSIRDIAIPAVDELRRQGWLLDGSLVNANLSKANISKAVLIDANLKGSFLFGADLTEANMLRATLQNANLILTNLQKANLRDANLQNTNLYGANLQKACLQRTNLQESTLRKANLQGANLQDAKNLDKADLQGAYADSHTKWPNDFNPEAAGIIIKSPADLIAFV